MIQSGRTMRKAADDGTFYRVTIRREDGTWGGDYLPPACETPAEVLGFFCERLQPCAKKEARIEVARIIDSTIGCMTVEDLGRARLFEKDGRFAWEWTERPERDGCPFEDAEGCKLSRTRAGGDPAACTFHHKGEAS